MATRLKKQQLKQEHLINKLIKKAPIPEISINCAALDLYRAPPAAARQQVVSAFQQHANGGTQINAAVQVPVLRRAITMIQQKIPMQQFEHSPPKQAPLNEMYEATSRWNDMVQDDEIERLSLTQIDK